MLYLHGLFVLLFVCGCILIFLMCLRLSQSQAHWFKKKIQALIWFYLIPTGCKNSQNAAPFTFRAKSYGDSSSLCKLWCDSLFSPFFMPLDSTWSQMTQVHFAPNRISALPIFSDVTFSPLLFAKIILQCLCCFQGYLCWLNVIYLHPWDQSKFINAYSPIFLWIPQIFILIVIFLHNSHYVPNTDYVLKGCDVMSWIVSPNCILHWYLNPRDHRMWLHLEIALLKLTEVMLE